MIALWIAFAALAAAASTAVLLPLRGRRGSLAAASGSPVAIYRDQLDEVERDLARGVISPVEGEAARTEIARRLIRADAGRDAPPAGGSDRARRLATAAIIAMPLAALGFYLLIGSPELPGEPLAARLSAPTEQQDILTLVARIEAHLKGAPDDARGWEVLAPVYIRLGRPEDAARAYANLIRLSGSTAEREASLGEALTTANRGVVTAEARAAFERAARLDPKAERPRFYLALALGQAGNKEEAIAAWRSLIDGAPANQPWVATARAELARLEGTPPSASGPTEADIAAAGAMSPAERQAMIEGMVGSLAARLEANPADPPGWSQLIRSYMVLGRVADARAALGRARAALAGDVAGLAGIAEAARTAGVPD